MPIVLKPGSLNLLETSGPVQACNGFVLPFFFLDKQEFFLRSCGTAAVCENWTKSPNSFETVGKDSISL